MKRMENTIETLHPKKKKKGGVQLGLGLVEESGFEPVASLLSTYVTMDKLFNLFDP